MRNYLEGDILKQRVTVWNLSTKQRGPL